MPRFKDDAALTELLRALEDRAYRFVSVTPATHARVIARRGEAECLRDIFGWSLPFRRATLGEELFALLDRAGAVEEAGEGLLKSAVRVSSLDEHLFLHSAYPTDDPDSVFFGPDTYRFVSMLRAELRDAGPVSRLVDIGTGSGAGGIMAAGMVAGAKPVLLDLNDDALQLAAANARAAGVEAELVHGASLDEVGGEVDLVIANPPYIMDSQDRTYRDGGGMHGAQISLDWTLAAARRVQPGGRVLLYTGVAMVKGHDELRERLEAELPALGCSLRYYELDPDIFGEELDEPAYRDVERIAAVCAAVRKQA